MADAVQTTGATVGSPAQIVDKILSLRDRYGPYHRQLFNIDLSSIPEAAVREMIDLAGAEILPALRRACEAPMPRSSENLVLG